MADIRATQTGDFSATTTWVGGVVPGSGDVAYANTFTVTISDTRTAQAISNASGTSITAGGTFSLLNGCNLTCTNANGILQGNTTTSCITTTSLAAGNTATVNSSLIHSSPASSSFVITHSGSGTLNINGNITGSGSNINSACLNLSGAGTCKVTGNAITGVGGSAGQPSDAIRVTGNGTLDLTGNLTGVAGAGVCLRVSAAAAFVSVTGNVQGNNAVINSATSTLTINGSCQSDAIGPAIGAGSLTQITRLSGPFLLGASGNINPVQAQSWRWAPTQIPTYYEVPTSGGTTKRNMFTSDNIPTANYPAPANVRSGSIYGPALENTGTLAVPAAGNVALGIPVDNTTGTAVLTSANVQTALGAFSSGRLNNCATVDSTGAQIQAAVSQ
jgi:hypothetical protein